MRKVTSYKCPVCNMRFKSLSAWGAHLARIHPTEKPQGYSDARYFYYCQTGKTEGRCIQCHKPTDWNEETGKYNRYCNNPKCKEEYCKMAKQRMVDKYGKTHLLNDPNKQREMLSHRKISGLYTFQDGGKVEYVGSYEKDFLATCDYVLGLKSSDIIAPSPHNYIYMYEGKPHVYIPDFYIPNFNLEIEVKDGGDNPNKHHKIQEVDKVKEKLKDDIMIANKSVLYFKVVNKTYTDFFDFIYKCKFAIDDDAKERMQKMMSPATESVYDIEDYEAIESMISSGIDDEEDLDMAMDSSMIIEDEEDIAVETITPQILYHGSNKLIRDIRPYSYDEHYCVYATADHDFALCYAGKQWNDLDINQCDYNGQLYLTEIRRGAFKQIFDCPGYIYSFDGSDFNQLNRHKFAREKPVLESEMSVEHIPNVLSALRKSGVKLIEYPKLPPFIRDRDEYITNTKDKFETYAANRYDRSSNRSSICSPSSINSPVVRRMTEADFLAISTNSLDLSITRDAYFNRQKRDPHFFENGENYGFYNRTNDKELMGILTITDAEGNDGKCIDLLVVDGKYRRHGLATRMLNYATNDLGANWLIVKKDNAPAIKLYKKYGFKSVGEFKGKTGSVIRMEYNTNAVESATESASKIDPNFKDKKHLNLSSFKVVKIDKPFLDKYKDKYSHLLDGVNPTSEKELAIAWLDSSGGIVAGVSVLYPDPNKPESYKHGNLIRCLEIYDDYRGHGLSEQVLDYAVKKMKGNSLYVMTDNEVAIRVYKDYGFKITPAGKTPVKYGKGSFYQMTLTGIEPVKESALKASERTDFGLPETKQYPMPDKEHVLLAIKFFNHVREDLEEELARNINKRIRELDVRDINIGDKNRFKKYYTPVEDSVMTGYSPIVGYQESWS